MKKAPDLLFQQKVKRIFFSYRLALVSLVIVCFSSYNVAHAQGDDCINSSTLANLTNFCSASGAYTNIGSTISNISAPSCWSNANNDVWFNFTAIGSDVDISVNGNNGTLDNPRLMLYYTTDCLLLNELRCEQSAVNNIQTLYKGGLTVGATYCIRVSSNDTGTFQLCINNYTPGVKSGQDCGTAFSLCNRNPVIVPPLSGPGNDPNEGAGTCIDINNRPIESNSTWYTWTAANNGTLTFDIVSSTGVDDIDFVLYTLTGSGCAGKSLIRCDAASCAGSTGLNMTSTDLSEPPDCYYPNDGYVRYVDMTAGTIYALLLNNFSSPSGFTITFGGTGDFQGANMSAGTVTASRDTICSGSPGFLTLNNSIGSPVQWQSATGADSFTDVSGANSTTYITQPMNETTRYRAVVGSGDCADTSAAFSLVVKPSPVAAFSEQVNGLQVNFNSQGSSGDVTEYQWNFDDGNTSFLANPVHSYSSADTFHVCLTVFNGSNCSFTICKDVLTGATGMASVSGQNKWKIYPNLTASEIYITGENTKDIEGIELYDVLGRRRLIKNFIGTSESSLHINISDLPEGIYYLKIKTDKNSFIQSIVKMK